MMSGIKTIALAIAATLSATGCKNDESPPAITTDDYRINVPAGFEVLDGEALARFEAEVGQRELVLYGESQQMLLLLDAVDGDTNPDTPESCVPLAAQWAKSDHVATPPRPVSVALPAYRTCRWEYATGREYVVFTVLRGRHLLWTLACATRNEPDAESRALCDQVARGFSAPPAAK